MLKEKDKIFTNIYGFKENNISGAIKRGDWNNTKKIISLGHETIIEKIKYTKANVGK